MTPGWAKSLIDRFTGSSLAPVSDDRRAAIIETVTIQTLSGLRQLLALDPEQQRTNPLTVFRRATAPITAHLEELNIPPVRRDEFEQRSFPEDIYGLYPATWADISEELVQCPFEIDPIWLFHPAGVPPFEGWFSGPSDDLGNCDCDNPLMRAIKHLLRGSF